MPAFLLEIVQRRETRTNESKAPVKFELNFFDI